MEVVVVAVCWRMAYEMVMVLLRMMMDVAVTVWRGMVEGLLVERKGLEGLL